VLLLDECLLLLFISLSTQSGNFWILPRVCAHKSTSVDLSGSFGSEVLFQPSYCTTTGAMSVPSGPKVSAHYI
jgi:hypothetical protein